MKTNYILIDYENVQPKNLAILNGHPFKVIVFVGANQAKIPFDVASSLQALGNNAEYIKIAGNGPNALDFHIAFYVGKLAERDPNCYFHIISKDTGFDPLIKHLKSKNIFAHTNLFTGRPARGIVNRIIRELGPIGSATPDFPLAVSALIPLRAKAERRGSGDFSSLWSGQYASGCKEVPAGQLTRDLASMLVS